MKMRVAKKTKFSNFLTLRFEKENKGVIMEKNIELGEHKFIHDRMEKKNHSILAMFLTRKQARDAIKSLRFHNYKDSDITLLKPERKAQHDYVYRQLTRIKTGVLLGGVLGFAITGFAGFVIGLYDPFSFGINSRLYYTLGGMILGLIFGLGGGALIGAGVPESAAKRYGFYLKEGGLVVMVHLKSEAEGVEVNSLLEKAGGQDIVILEESQVWSSVMPDKKKMMFH